MINPRFHYGEIVFFLILINVTVWNFLLKNFQLIQFDISIKIPKKLGI